MRQEYIPKPWIQKNWFVPVIIVLGLILDNIFLFIPSFQGSKVESENASQYGSFIAGYAGTILSVLSFLLLVLTFRDQREKSQVENFGTRVFELVGLHRDNVGEIGIGEDFGKKVFVVMLREFRTLFRLVKKISVEHNTSFSNSDLAKITYHVFYYGVGPNSTRVLKRSLGNQYQELLGFVIEQVTNKKIKSKEKNAIRLRYTPFEGHQSRLGHYFRHFYASIQFIDASQLDLDKYEYVKILRVQLSNHEQALLFFNSLSELGKKWKDEKLIEKYQLIKNVPQDFFDSVTEIDMKAEYPNVYFEWEEEAVAGEKN